MRVVSPGEHQVQGIIHRMEVAAGKGERFQGECRAGFDPVGQAQGQVESLLGACRGLGLGADEYVVKPFLREVLIHNVERLLAQPKTDEADVY